jgi:hypothetical protein
MIASEPIYDLKAIRTTALAVQHLTNPSGQLIADPSGEDLYQIVRKLGYIRLELA